MLLLLFLPVMMFVYFFIVAINAILFLSRNGKRTGGRQFTRENKLTVGPKWRVSGFFLLNIKQWKSFKKLK